MSITEVPTLAARDFCRNRFRNGKRSCLSGWSMRVTGHSYDKNPDRHKDRNSVIEALAAQIEKSEHYVKDRHASCFSSVGAFNDDEKVPKAELAKVWNAAMTDLGFDEEADTNGREIWGEMEV